MKFLKLGLSLLLCGILSSCSNWINVKPTDRLSEDLLFSNTEGFLKALNGIYVEMTSSSSYGRDMSAGAVDVLAQYYYMSSSTHVYYDLTTFDYTQEGPLGTFDRMWSKSFELIANCNVLLEHCGNAPGNALPEPYFSLVKGETLALRAMLHLDMLRLFGPSWSQESQKVPSIPYLTSVQFDVSPLLSSQDVIKHILTDLQAASQLLADVDPVRTEGVRHASNPAGSNAFHYRQYRLNYYAVQALLARAYLWKADRTSALNTVKALLSEIQSGEEPVFPFVTFADATSVEFPDRVFSSEVMFALYDINRVKMYNELFSPALDVRNKLSFNGGNTNESRVNALYDDANDYRRRIWQNVSAGSLTSLSNLKYQDVVDGPGRYMIPLIRLSEVLLIAAECSGNLQEGTAFLNMVRASRNCVDLAPDSPEALQKAITAEFRKETLGEGQQFFFYKRIGAETVPSHASLTGTKTMVLRNYVIPLPESELSKRGEHETK